MREHSLMITVLLLLLVDAASAANEECNLKPDGGNCERALYRYYYDPVLGDCERFIYTGCDGNGNRFIRRSHCRERCLQPEATPGLTQVTGKETTTAATTTTERETLVLMASRPSQEVYPIGVQGEHKSPTAAGVTAARSCTGCDPLFGVCQPDGRCGCKQGYQKSGRICIDVDECEVAGVCPPEATCINTLGGFSCNCGTDKTCNPLLDPYEILTTPPPPSTNPPFIYTPPEKPQPTTDNPVSDEDESRCADPFDMKINENCGVLLPRYYYESTTEECRAVLYGGCRLTSKNIFLKRIDCEDLCLKKIFKPSSSSSSTPHSPHHQHPRVPDASEVLPSVPRRRPSDLGPSILSQRSQDSVTTRKPISDFGPPFRVVEPKRTDLPPPPWEDSTTTQSPDPFHLLDSTASGVKQAVSPGVGPSEVSQDTPQPPPATPSTHTSEKHTDDLGSPCLQPFDPVLREECLTSAWEERFFFDKDAEACVPFWYDTSCKEEERKGKNYFDTMKDCQHCLNTFDPKKDFIEMTPPVASSLRESMAFTSRSPYISEEQLEYRGEEEEGRDENEILQVVTLPSTTTTTTSERATTTSGMSEEEETKKTEDAFLSVTNSGKCSGRLDERLEEDCNGGDWMTKYFYSSEKGKCRPFWYGGCQVDVDNFYPSDAACAAACGNLFPVPSDIFKQHAELMMGTMKPRVESEVKKEGRPTGKPIKIVSSSEVEQPSWTTEIAPVDIIITEEPQTTTTTTEEPTFPPLPTASDLVYPIENTIRSRGSISFSTSTLAPHPAEHPEYDQQEDSPEESPSIPAGGPTDPCEDPVDEKLEEECSTDWVSRTYFDLQHQKCVKFWYGGCEVKSRNLFMDEQSCKAVCGHKMPTLPPPFTSPQPPSHSTTTAPLLPTPAPLRTSSEASTTNTAAASASAASPGDRSDENHQEIPEVPEVQEVQEVQQAQEVQEVQEPSKDQAVEAFPQPQSLSWTGDEQPQPPPREQFDEDDVPQPPPSAHHVAVPEEKPAAEEKNEEGPQNMASTDSTSTVSSVDVPPVTMNTTRKRTTITLKGFTASVVTKDGRNEGKTPEEKTDEKLEEKLEQKLEGEDEPSEPTTLALTSNAQEYFTYSWECMVEHRRDAPSRECGKEERNWTQRYFFDHSSRSCRMFWGCENGEKSGNNFPDLMTCQWKCEPEQSSPTVRSCLEPLDPVLEEDCSHGKFETRFHFDFASKRCVSFHYGGCRSPSSNYFEGLEQCKNTCERPDHTVSQSCLEAFDRGFLNTCNVNGRFEPKYFYDSNADKCEMFWWGGCRRSANNFFASLETCKWSCERPKKAEGPRQCHDPFDKKLSESCEDGQWKERFYFDHETGSCQPFWWDGCYSESANFFRDRASCDELCLQPETSEIGDAKSLKEEFRCLEPKKVGECRETYPAFYYDRNHRECRPFSYSGCGGNGNRFLTIAQCNTLCKPFTLLSESESGCYLPLDTGHSEGACGKDATIGWHFDRKRGKCAEFWFRGCGGNGNRFDSLAVCNRICAAERRPGPLPVRRTRSTHGVLGGIL